MICQYAMETKRPLKSLTLYFLASLLMVFGVTIVSVQRVATGAAAPALIFLLSLCGGLVLAASGLIAGWINEKWVGVGYFVAAVLYSIFVLVLLA